MAKTSSLNQSASATQPLSSLEYLSSLDSKVLDALAGIAKANQSGHALKAVRSFQTASSVLGPISKMQGKVSNLSFSGKEQVKITTNASHGLSKESLSAAKKERSKLAAWKLLTGDDCFIPTID